MQHFFFDVELPFELLVGDTSSPPELIGGRLSLPPPPTLNVRVPPTVPPERLDFGSSLGGLRACNELIMGD